MAEEISWDEAVETSGFVKFEQDKQKVITIVDWELKRRADDAKVGAGEIEFEAKVTLEDGKEVEKVINSTSKRLKKKLKAILETKDKTVPVVLSVLKVGDKYDTQYSIVEVK